MPAHSRPKDGVASLAYVAGIIHVFLMPKAKTWMSGTRQHKAGHDECLKRPECVGIGRRKMRVGRGKGPCLTDAAR
jgi:hypothetical protein